MVAGAPIHLIVSPPSEWNIAGNQLCVSYPPDWALLWELENYLEPSAPGHYPLTPGALRRAARRGALEGVELGWRSSLPAILERGLGELPPDDLLAALAAQPVLRLLPGVVLQFSDTQELLRLRQAISWRRVLENLISPRHVLLDPWQAPRLVRRLYRKGLLSENDLELTQGASMPGSSEWLVKDDPVPRNRVLTWRLSIAERAYLLSLLLLAEGLAIPNAPPPGLLAKLTSGMQPALRAAAAGRATQALAEISPQPHWEPEDETPPEPEGELLEYLQYCADRKEAIDILYQAPRKATPEYRHVSPLLVERRGARHYLIAYCHTRRANRTFRLDRIQRLDFPLG